VRIFDWYYSNGDLPLTNREQREIRRRAWRLWKRDRRNKVLYVTLPVVVFLTAGSIVWFDTNFWQRWILLSTVILLGSLVKTIIERVSVVPLGRRLMRERGIDVCIRCGYWLRDLGKDIAECPECGRRREDNKEIESTQE